MKSRFSRLAAIVLALMLLVPTLVAAAGTGQTQREELKGALVVGDKAYSFKYIEKYTGKVEREITKEINKPKAEQKLYVVYGIGNAKNMDWNTVDQTGEEVTLYDLDANGNEKTAKYKDGYLVAAPQPGVPVNKDNLNAKVEEAQDQLENNPKVTSAVEALEEAINKAKQVANDANATQAQVDAAKTALEQAINAYKQADPAKEVPAEAASIKPKEDLKLSQDDRSGQDLLGTEERILASRSALDLGNAASKVKDTAWLKFPETRYTGRNIEGVIRVFFTNGSHKDYTVKVTVAQTGGEMPKVQNPKGKTGHDIPFVIGNVSATTPLLNDAGDGTTVQNYGQLDWNNYANIVADTANAGRHTAAFMIDPLEALDPNSFDTDLIAENIRTGRKEVFWTTGRVLSNGEFTGYDSSIGNGKERLRRGNPVTNAPGSDSPEGAVLTGVIEVNFKDGGHVNVPVQYRVFNSGKVAAEYLISQNRMWNKNTLKADQGYETPIRIALRNTQTANIIDNYDISIPGATNNATQVYSWNATTPGNGQDDGNRMDGGTSGGGVNVITIYDNIFTPEFRKLVHAVKWVVPSNVQFLWEGRDLDGVTPIQAQHTNEIRNNRDFVPETGLKIDALTMRIEFVDYPLAILAGGVQSSSALDLPRTPFYMVDQELKSADVDVSGLITDQPLYRPLGSAWMRYENTNNTIIANDPTAVAAGLVAGDAGKEGYLDGVQWFYHSVLKSDAIQRLTGGHFAGATTNVRWVGEPRVVEDGNPRKMEATLRITLDNIQGVQERRLDIKVPYFETPRWSKQYPLEDYTRDGVITLRRGLTDSEVRQAVAQAVNYQPILDGMGKTHLNVFGVAYYDDAQLVYTPYTDDGTPIGNRIVSKRPAGMSEAAYQAQQILAPTANTSNLRLQWDLPYRGWDDVDNIGKISTTTVRALYPDGSESNPVEVKYMVVE